MSKQSPPPKRHFGRPKPSAIAARSAPPVPQPPINDWITLGTIVAPFGLHGEVKLLAQTDFPDRIAAHKTLYLGADHRAYPLEKAHPHAGVILLKLAGVDDMTAAERLRNLTVFIPATEAAPLAPDQYFIHDLVGLRAQHISGADLGVVADVISGAAQDLLVIRFPGKPDVLVPLVKALVPTVDLPNHIAIIDPPAGLFDDDFLEG